MKGLLLIGVVVHLLEWPNLPPKPLPDCPPRPPATIGWDGTSLTVAEVKGMVACDTSGTGMGGTIESLEASFTGGGGGIFSVPTPGGPIAVSLLLPPNLPRPPPLPLP